MQVVNFFGAMPFALTLAMVASPHPQAMATRAAAASPPTETSALTIRSGMWNDTCGLPVEAHGGCVLQSPLNLRWYLYGETRKYPVTTNLSADVHEYRGLAQGINCYSASSLAGPWELLR